MGALIPAKIANIPGLPVQIRERGMQPISDRVFDIGQVSPIQVPNVGGLRGYTVRQKHVAVFAATHLSAIVANYSGDNSLSETPGRNNVQYKVAFQKNGLPATATFSANPAVSDTLTINSVAITFVASGATGNQVNIGGTLAATLASLASLMNGASATFKCTAIVSGSVVTFQVIAGTLGSSVAFTKSSAAITLSAPTLLGSSTGWNDQSQPRIPAFFNGNKVADVPPGGLMMSDPVAFEVAAGEVFFVILYVGCSGSAMYLPAGGSMMGNPTIGNSCDNGDAKVNEDAFEFGALSLSVASNQAGAVAVLGASNTAQRTVGFCGDSIAGGSGDYGAQNNNAGYLWRTMAGLDQAINLSAAVERTRVANFSFIKYTRGADTLANFVNRANFFQGTRLLTMCSTVISQLGVNDLGASAGLAAMQVNYLTLAAYFTSRGIKFIQCTITPRTGSTDGFLTVTNQVVSSFESVRVALNTWLRDTSASGFVAQCNAPGFVDVWDAAAAIEVNSSNGLTLNGGFWPAAYSTGLATGTLTAISGVTYTDSAETTTLDQWRGYYMRMTSGAASGNQSAVIYNVASGIFTLNAAITGSPSVGDSYQICMVSTLDGTHPSTESHRRIAAYITGNNLLSKII